MSAQASLRWWWVGLVVSVATLAGLWIGEATFDLPRVTSFTSLIPGTIIPASWMAAGLISGARARARRSGRCSCWSGACTRGTR